MYPNSNHNYSLQSPQAPILWTCSIFPYLCCWTSEWNEKLHIFQKYPRVTYLSLYVGNVILRLPVSLYPSYKTVWGIFSSLLLVKCVIGDWLFIFSKCHVPLCKMCMCVLKRGQGINSDTNFTWSLKELNETICRENL